MNTDLKPRHDRAMQTLQVHGQEHLLTFFNDLDDTAAGALLDEIEARDWAHLQRLIETYVLKRPEAHVPEHPEPAPCYPVAPTPDRVEKYTRARALGEQLLREGKVAAFVVAGGQGTRLGFDGPKGAYPATPVNGKPLFQVFADYLLKIAEKYGKPVPWYVMTSGLNHQPTVDFFKQHNHFGLNPDDVMFFTQGTMPSIGYDGRVLLAERGMLALNPDGHGGSLRALHVSGALEDMTRRGVEQISYFQVDNPNVKCIDPLFLGLHALDGAQMSSKMVLKTGPHEKVGNFAEVDGRIVVIEYSDLPDALAEAKQPDGTLKFNAGSIAIHAISRAFVEQLNAGGFSLPFHRADKKVAHIDLSTGQRIEPTEPNAVKLEAFVFDALPLAEKSIVLQTDRVEEFAPIKNATGVDSAETSRRLQSERAARWLEAKGVTIPRCKDGMVDAHIELSHRTAVEADDLDNLELPDRIEPGSERVL